MPNLVESKEVLHLRALVKEAARTGTVLWPVNRFGLVEYEKAANLRPKAVCALFQPPRKRAA